MMRKVFGATTICAVIIAMGVFAFSGCGKTESGDGAGGTGGQPSMQGSAPKEEGSAPKEGEKEESAEKTEGEETGTAAEEGEKQEEGGDGEKVVSGEKEGPPEGMVKLDADLPEPMFQGTPTNFETDNLDPNTGEARGDVFVPEGTKLVSKDASVTSSYPNPIIGDLEQITDGEKAGHEGTYVTLGPGKQWVQIDLGKKQKIQGILLWHYHSQARVYHDVIVQVSNDKDFLEAKTVFNNDHDNSSGLGIGDDYEYVETNEGRWIEVDGVTGRYVRVYSKGNTSNEMNHYTELEVYAQAAE